MASLFILVYVCWPFLNTTFWVCKLKYWESLAIVDLWYTFYTSSLNLLLYIISKLTQITRSVLLSREDYISTGNLNKDLKAIWKGLCLYVWLYVKEICCPFKMWSANLSLFNNSTITVERYIFFNLVYIWLSLHVWKTDALG